MHEVVKIIPLGGCGEVGMNIMIISVDDHYYFIDAGNLFPDASLLGVELILPDTRYLDEKNIQPTAWFITHGHEDHIGALPFLYKKYPAPIYSTPFTCELIKSKFLDADIQNATIIAWDFFQTQFLPKLQITPFPVNHSIAQAAGFFIETAYANLLHMGDFRIDTNSAEKTMSHKNIELVLQNKSVSLMLSDSTNVFQTGTDKNEEDVLPALKEIFLKTKGLVVVATFSSNIWRMQHIFDAAKASGRKLALFGRSMLKNSDIAKRLNLLHYQENELIDITEIELVGREHACLICTGSQGEYFSGLSRLAWNNVNEIQLKPHDNVVFSSRIIPGNEKVVDAIMNQIAHSGAETTTVKEDSRIHVSGHAYVEDLKCCIYAARPQAFMPVHGTYRHLKKHREIAIECGISAKNCFLVENGNVLAIRTTSPEFFGIIDKVHNGRDFLGCGGVFSQSSQIFKDRMTLVRTGVICVSFVLDKKDPLTLSAEPVVSSLGVPLDSVNLSSKCIDLFVGISAQIERRKRNLNFETVKDDLRIAIRRYLEKILNYKPTIIVLISFVL